jgi:hypothetical protein
MSNVRGRPFETKHGHAGWNGKSRTYQAWIQMKLRCKNHPHYRLKNIKVCERWIKFDSFLEDMGARPDECGIDRIDNSKGYSKENCRWATKIQQMNNQSKNIFVSAFGEIKTLAEWARSEICKTGYAGLRKRILRGISPEIAITTPNRHPCGVMEEAR